MENLWTIKRKCMQIQKTFIEHALEINRKSLDNAWKMNAGMLGIQGAGWWESGVGWR